MYCEYLSQSINQSIFVLHPNAPQNTLYNQEKRTFVSFSQIIHTFFFHLTDKMSKSTSVPLLTIFQIRCFTCAAAMKRLPYSSTCVILAVLLHLVVPPQALLSQQCEARTRKTHQTRAEHFSTRVGCESGLWLQKHKTLAGTFTHL